MKPKLLLLLLLTLSVPIVSARPENDRCDSTCNWDSNHVNSLTIESFPRCETVCAYVILDGKSDVTEGKLVEVFKDMKHLFGTIMVSGTNFTSVKFLENLETVKSEDTFLTFRNNSQLAELSLPKLSSIIGLGLNAELNSKLKTVHLPKLENLALSHTPKKKDPVQQPAIIISKTSKDYCISLEDMERLMRIGADVNGIREDYCSPKFYKNVCKEPREGCIWITGDVEIGPDFDLKSMKSVQAIFGTLTINGTDLEDFGFLENLQYMAPMLNEDNDKSTILVTNNGNLTNIKMPNLKYVQGNLPNTISFENNNENLLDNFHLCRELGENVNFHHQRFDGLACYDYEMRAYQKRFDEDPSRKYVLRTCFSLLFGFGTLVSLYLFYRKCYRKSGYQGPVRRTVE